MRAGEGDAGARLGLLACVATVLALGIGRIGCPGLYYDEALFVSGWRPGDPCSWRVGPAPVMQLSYLGAVKSWLYLPFADRLSPALVRIPSVLMATLSLVLAYAIARRLAGRSAALAAAALLAVDPAFVFLQRLDWGPVALGVLLRTGSLLLILQWRENGSAWRLPLAGLLIGLGLYDKVIFAWYVAALGAAVVLTRRAWRVPSLRCTALTLAAAALGAAPLIAFNVMRPFATLRSNAIVAQVPLSRLVAERLDLIAGTLSGVAVHGLVNQAALGESLPCPGIPETWRWLCGPSPHAGSWMPRALIAALALVLLMRALRTDVACRLLGVLVVGTAAMFLPLALASGAHHVAVLLPFPQILVAVVAARVAQRRPRARRVALIAIIGILASSTLTSMRTAASFAGLCGRGSWSSAIYDVADFVAAHPADRVLIGDWGFYTQLRVLVPKAQLDDVSWRLNDGTIMPDAFAPAVGQRTFLLLHRRATTSFPQARRHAVELVRRTGLRTRMVARLRDLDGRPNAEIVELLPPDTTARTKPG